MPTRFQCKTCKVTFVDSDPTYSSTGAIEMPYCPNGPMAEYFLNMDLPPEERERTLPDSLMDLLDQDEREHPVSLAIVSGPPPTSQSKSKAVQPKEIEKQQNITNRPPLGVWGSVPSSVNSQETMEEKKVRMLREQQEQRERDVLEQEREAALKARRLVHQIEQMIKSGEFTVSSNFAMDREYGFKTSGNQLEASSDTIKRASDIWRSKADTSYRGPSYKRMWDQFQANFEKLIVSGDPSKGKHNVHVVRR